MKILTLKRIFKGFSGLHFGEYHILNPYSLKEISEDKWFDPLKNEWISVTELLFKDGHKTHVQESADVVKDLWKDSL